MKFAYDSAANRPAICDPGGAVSAPDTGRSFPLSEFGPHSVTMTGIPAGQPNIAVPSPARTYEKISGISISGAEARTERPPPELPPYQCRMAMSKLGQAAASTLAFQSGYSLFPTRTAPTLI